MRRLRHTCALAPSNALTSEWPDCWCVSVSVCACAPLAPLQARLLLIDKDYILLNNQPHTSTSRPCPSQRWRRGAKNSPSQLLESTVSRCVRVLPEPLYSAGQTVQVSRYRRPQPMVVDLCLLSPNLDDSLCSRCGKCCGMYGCTPRQYQHTASTVVHVYQY